MFSFFKELCCCSSNNRVASSFDQENKINNLNIVVSPAESPRHESIYGYYPFPVAGLINPMDPTMDEVISALNTMFNGRKLPNNKEIPGLTEAGISPDTLKNNYEMRLGSHEMKDNRHPVFNLIEFKISKQLMSEKLIKITMLDITRILGTDGNPAYCGDYMITGELLHNYSVAQLNSISQRLQ